MRKPSGQASIDDLMNDASEALARAEYHACADLSRRALLRARRRSDFERMARICLPLQESQRWVRQSAEESGRVIVVDSHGTLVHREGPCCALVRPPLLGIDARDIRERAWRARVPCFVLAVEPTTSEGRCPVVAVPALGETPVRSIRAYVPPFPGDALTVAWFTAAGEALGDAAIARVSASDHPAHRVDDLLEALDAIPEHEKLHQALEQACREAAGAGAPPGPRRRPIVDDPRGF